VPPCIQVCKLGIMGVQAEPPEVNVAGTIRLARKLGPGKTIVTILCDPATRYQSRLFNPEFLRSKGLVPPEWLEQPQSLEPDLL